MTGLFFLFFRDKYKEGEDRTCYQNASSYYQYVIILIGGASMAGKRKIQLNVRLSPETVMKLNEIVDYYQEHTKVGRVYKADVLTDIIDKAYEVMQKQKNAKKYSR